MNLRSRLKKAWNMFTGKEPSPPMMYYGSTSSYNPINKRLSFGNEQTIVAAIYNKIAVDVSMVDIKHVNLDKQDRFEKVRDSSLNSCLTLSANKDQTGKALIRDAVLSMFDEGYVAIVPTSGDKDAFESEYADIESLRVARIIDWMPDHVRIDIYNDVIGDHKEYTVPKYAVAIIENPFYSVMNQRNSTVRRLVRKLALLDAIDEQSSSGKLDIIIQVPYAAANDIKRSRIDERKEQIEGQLTGSKYGIAYIDGTEKITQLNRPAENNLMTQVEYLTELAFSQLGMTKEILNGTADEATMLNYNNRIVYTILTTLVDEMKRKYLSPTARTQRQTIMFFPNPFKLTTLKDMSETADKLTRNEIMTSNEVRGYFGLPPSSDPNADKLVNKNLNQPDSEKKVDETITVQDETDKPSEKSKEKNQNG